MLITCKIPSYTLKRLDLDIVFNDCVETLEESDMSFPTAPIRKNVAQYVSLVGWVEGLKTMEHFIKCTKTDNQSVSIGLKKAYDYLLENNEISTSSVSANFILTLGSIFKGNSMDIQWYVKRYAFLYFIGKALVYMNSKSTTKTKTKTFVRMVNVS